MKDGSKLERIVTLSTAINEALPRETASALRHVDHHTQPGIRRMRCGKGFRYLDPTGRTVRDGDVLQRIRSLAIPPAWTDVWICVDANGHLQAVGKDAKGRRQYLYHPLWRELRDAVKFERLLDVARVLPAVRARVDADLAQRGLCRPRILATVVKLLEITLIRVGNEEYARTNDSYGLTTLEERHCLVEGTRIRFEFKGKSGKMHAIDLKSPRLARIVKQLHELPGQALFQYLDDTRDRRHIASEDVNAYLKEIGGDFFTAKQFRTWMATVRALEHLGSAEPPTSMTHGKRVVRDAMVLVSKLLGNTPTICRQSYVHPAVVSHYMEGTLREWMVVDRRRADRRLEPGEQATVAFLERLAKSAMKKAA